MDEIKDCVRCGYCCKVAPCQYGETSQFFTRYPGFPKACFFLIKDYTDNLHTYVCAKWEEIEFEEQQQNEHISMCGSGCPDIIIRADGQKISTPCNVDRWNIIERMRKRAVQRILHNG